MKLTNWFLNFDFGGRARRSHTWANWFAWLGIWIVLWIVMLSVAGAGVAADEAGNEAAAAGAGGLGVLGVLVMFVAWLLAFVDSMAMNFRRAHDTGRSGWIWLLLLIPLVNLLPLYWLLIEDSHQGANKYGPPVKQFYEPNSAAT